MKRIDVTKLEEDYERFVKLEEIFEPEGDVAKAIDRLSERIKTKQDVRNVIQYLLEVQVEDWYWKRAGDGGLSAEDIRLLREEATAIRERRFAAQKRKMRAYRADVNAMDVYCRWREGETINALAKAYGVHRDTIRSRIDSIRNSLKAFGSSGDTFLPFL